jgi:hypothetical protein
VPTCGLIATICLSISSAVAALLCLLVVAAGAIIYFRDWLPEVRKLRKKLGTLSASTADPSAFAKHYGVATDVDVAKMTYESEKGLYADLAASTTSCEAKASSILGFLGAGLSIYALFEGRTMGANSNVTAFLYVGTALLIVALFASVYTLVAGRRRGLPELTKLEEHFAEPSVTQLVALSYLSFAWRRRATDLRVLNLRKKCSLAFTQIAFLVGAAALVSNALVAASIRPSDQKQMNVECRFFMPRASGNMSNISCKAKEDRDASR